MDDGDTLTIQFAGVETACDTSWDLNLIVAYDANRYREHTNQTGGQWKVRGVRDDAADVSLDIQEFPNDEHIIDADIANVAFSQAVSEQFHSTGSPDNPQP
jgi:hypothetical protein